MTMTTTYEGRADFVIQHPAGRTLWGFLFSNILPGWPHSGRGKTRGSGWRQSDREPAPRPRHGSQRAPSSAPDPQGLLTSLSSQPTPSEGRPGLRRPCCPVRTAPATRAPPPCQHPQHCSSGHPGTSLSSGAALAAAALLWDTLALGYPCPNSTLISFPLCSPRPSSRPPPPLCSAPLLCWLEHISSGTEGRRPLHCTLSLPESKWGPSFWPPIHPKCPERSTQQELSMPAGGRVHAGEGRPAAGRPGPGRQGRAGETALSSLGAGSLGRPMTPSLPAP